MPRRAGTAVLLVLAAVRGDASVDSTSSVPGASLQEIRVRTYTMSGAVRPLLFWISRDGVGFARITWRRGGNDARGYELLVGTDPGRAPRGINRWGYIAEEVHGAEGSVLALMTGSPDASYDDEASAAGAGPSAAEFRAIRGALGQGAASWQVARIQPPKVLTIHDLGAALEHVGPQMAIAPLRDGRATVHARPGFLVAVADAIDLALGNGSRPSVSPAVREAPIAYVFGREAYELRLRESSPVSVTHAGRSTPALRLRFETRAATTGSRARFDVICGTRGELTGVPIVIEWQPRWWLRATLRLQ
jgi:hypothetical protein